MPEPTTHPTPPTPDTSQRDPLGRFLKGNILGKGNPFARHSAALRKAFYDAVTPEDLSAIAQALTEAAKGGNWVAAQVLLKWLLGKPPEAIDPWELLIQAAAREAVHRVRQELQGEPVHPPDEGCGEEAQSTLEPLLRLR